MIGFRLRRRPVRDVSANANAIRVPNHDRDPYFNRTAGADQVAPPTLERVETVLSATDSEPAIVRDYRLRREMIGVERGFEIAGSVGFVIGTISAVILLGFLSSTIYLAIQSGPLATWVRSREHGYFLGWMIIIGSFASMAWICRGLRGGQRWAQLILTLEAISEIAGAGLLEIPAEWLIVSAPSFILIILMLWRPRGRFYFTERYRELVERTPAQTFSRNSGQGWASLFLTSMIVIHFSIGYFLMWILGV